MVAETAAFKTAVQDSRKLTSKPTDNELLELYALYKTGTGEDFSKAPKPGMFDLKVSGPIMKYNLSTYRVGTRGKAKYNAWSKVATEDKISPADAQEKYVEMIEKHKATYGYDANKDAE